MKRIILTGGGTAGHIYPVIEVGKTLKKNLRIKLLYVGSNNGPEKKLVKDIGITFKGIYVGKRRPYLSIENFFDLFKIFFGLIQAYFIFRKFRPNIIFAKGGYVTFPIIFWAKRFKTPLIIHESDIVMGKTNLWAASFAKKICLGFPIKYFFEYNKIDKTKIPLEKLVYTGIPLRREFFSFKQSENKSLPRILFTGGSQGSSKINQILMQILPDLFKKYEVFHLSGARDYKTLKEKFGEQKNYILFGYTEKMAGFLSDADLVISRAGANTLAEISALGKPAILIPLPSAAADHQNINAKVYQDSNAAVTLSEKNLTSSSLLSIINRLMEDTELRRLLGHHAQEFSVKNAVSIITDLIYEVE